MVLIIVAMVALPFVLWRMTWFGGPLSDEKLEAYLSSADEARNTQHALVQLTERIDADRQSASRFYPQVIALAESDKPAIRNMVAWVMGWDASHEPFRKPLLALLHDPQLVVRQNAALSLTNFGDDAGLGVIRDMLKPTTVLSPASGTLVDLLNTDAPVQFDMEIGEITPVSGRPVNIYAPIDGTMGNHLVPEGKPLRTEQAVCAIKPGQSQLWEALRALTRIGTEQDKPAIQRLIDSREVTEEVRKQAEQTLRAITNRQGQPSP